jgi:hypothetical protein
MIFEEDFGIIVELKGLAAQPGVLNMGNVKEN